VRSSPPPRWSAPKFRAVHWLSLALTQALAAAKNIQPAVCQRRSRVRCEFHPTSSVKGNAPRNGTIDANVVAIAL
jgi:hypothetical protein